MKLRIKSTTANFESVRTVRHTVELRAFAVNMASKMKNGVKSETNVHSNGRASHNSSASAEHLYHPAYDGPITFTNKSRVDEKNALIGLNHRLAGIIERNQHLENANSSLMKELHKEKESSVITVTKLKHTYSTDLADGRKQIQQLEKELAKRDLEHDQHSKELSDTKIKLEKKAQEAAGLQKKISQSTAQFNQLHADFQRAADENDKLVSANKDLEDENERLTADLDALIKKLESECIEKIEVQNLLKSNMEELNMKEKVFEQELLNVDTRRQIEQEEIDGRLQREYESRLADDIQLLRNEYGLQLAANKEAQENFYKSTEADLRAQIQRLKDTISSKTQELNYISAKMDSHLPKISNLEGEIFGLQQIIRKLEEKIKKDGDSFAEQLNRKDEENEQLRGEKERLLKDYHDLLDTKVELYNEIATYQMLLEREERRLSSTPEPFMQHKTYNETYEESYTKRTQI